MVARNTRLNDRQPGMVSAEDVAKAEGDLKVAEAQIKEAQENQGIAKAELELAKRTLDEHTIIAPFDGIVLSRKKHPGESVRANDTVIELGDLSRLAAEAYVPLEYAYRVKVGQIVEIQPRLRPMGARGSRCRSRRSGSAARSPSSTRRSKRWPGPRCGSGRSSRTPGRPAAGPLCRQMTVFLPQDVAAAGPEASAPERTGRRSQ